MSGAVDLGAAQSLFDTLDQIHIVAIQPDAPRSYGPQVRDFGSHVGNALEWALERNKAGENIYWTVNAVRQGLYAKPRKIDMIAARFAHVDIDPPKDGFGWEPEAVEAQLAALPCPPSFIINSGNGLQAFWRLSNPAENWRPIETTNLAIRELFGADACHNIDRLMRVPGFINYPNAKKRAAGRVPVLASWIEPDNGVCYKLEELSAAFPLLARDHSAAEQLADSGKAAEYEFQMLTPDDLGLGASSSIRSAIEHPPGIDRSGDGLAVARLMANDAYSDTQIMGVLLNPINAVSAHYLNQRDARRAALRTIELIHRTPSQGRTQPPDPVDLWARYEPMPLPVAMTPPVIEQFARTQGELMGVDPGGLAMAALAVCAAALSDRIAVQVKEHDPSWRESARLWVALIGPPSTKKSPIMNVACRPLIKIDSRLFTEYTEANNEYRTLPPAEQKCAPLPKQRRLRITDATVEAVQEVLKASPDGVLSQQDELSGWFGGMDKYGAGKGAMADRAFWLQAYNGGPYALNRVSRGAALIPNLSISVLGGIQPGPLRKLVNDAVDDGLIQRLIPVLLGPASVGIDAPRADEVDRYHELVSTLWQMKPPGQEPMATLGEVGVDAPLIFDTEAQGIRRELERRHHDMMSTELISPKMASHFGKYDGLFARLCVLWHCILHAKHPELPRFIRGDTASQVANFLHSYIVPNAVAFYVGTLGLADDHETLVELAAYILSKKLEKVQSRDIQRGSRSLRALTADQSRLLCEKLESLGWLIRSEGWPFSRAPHWQVNSVVHEKFAHRGREEAERRTKAREAIHAALHA